MVFKRWIITAVSFCILSACSTDKPEILNLSQIDRDNFPRRLSAWGVIYRQGQTLALNDGVIAYDLNSPLFTDYAHKLRTIWLPAGATITYSDETDLQLPMGAIVSKTFYYPRTGNKLLQTDDYGADFNDKGLDLNRVQLIETRIMVRLDDGWHGLPYVWNQAQTEAELKITGDVQNLELHSDHDSTTFPYIVPDANQCDACHVDNMSSKETHLLGVKLRHVDKPYAGIYSTDSQLDEWLNQNKLQRYPKNRIANVNWQDASQPLTARALSYLDINCGHCHNPLGPADTSGLFLDNNSFANAKGVGTGSYSVNLGICKPPVAAGQGTGGHKVGISPGHADQSILIYRMQSLDLGAMMPELGRSLIHNEGLVLISEWINAMPGDCE